MYIAGLLSVGEQQARDRWRDTSIVIRTGTRAYPGCSKERTDSSGGQRRGLIEGQLHYLLAGLILGHPQFGSLSACWEPVCHSSALSNNEFVFPAIRCWGQKLGDI